MSNPFPGMDPFLEQPARWPSVHHRLIGYLADAISVQLPKHYTADIGERVFVSCPPKSLYPDVSVVKHPRKKKRAASSAAKASVMEADPFVDIEFPPEEIHEVFVEIERTDEPGKLVTVLEILSPTNKTAGEGRTKYLEKQKQLLGSTTHLVEIDLWRAGQHTVAVPRDCLAEEGWDYLVCLHRGGWQDKFRVWPVPLPRRLPRISVPLAGNDPDLVVDLQALLDHCHEMGGYAERLDYRSKCPPPLSKKNAKWVDELLRKKKLRK